LETFKKLYGPFWAVCTEKKNFERIMSNYRGCFFMFPRAKEKCISKTLSTQNKDVISLLQHKN
jgi:hypothetical protein